MLLLSYILISFFSLLHVLFRFYEYHMTAKIYPTMVLEGLFSTEIIESALLFDSSPSTHSLSYYVEMPDAIRKLYDAITYNKCK